MIRGVVRGVLVALAVAVGVVTVVSAQAMPAVTKCPTASAGGHTYSVSVTKVTCSFADGWVAKLAGKRLAPHSAQVKLAGGPKGFKCVGGSKPAGVDMGPGIAGNVDIGGNCAKGLGLFGGSPYFNWVAKRKG